MAKPAKTDSASQSKVAAPAMNERRLYCCCKRNVAFRVRRLQKSKRFRRFIHISPWPNGRTAGRSPAGCGFESFWGPKSMRDTLQADHALRGLRFVALTGWRCFVRENALQQNLRPSEKVRLLFAPTMILFLFLAWRAAVFRHQTSLFFVHRGYERYEGKGRECGRRKGRERGLLRSGSRGNGRVSA